MVTKTFNVELDVLSTIAKRYNFNIIQNDVSANIFNITMYSNTSILNLSSVSSATITFQRSNLTTVVGAATISATPTTGIITYTCGTSEVSVAGLVKATVELYGASSERLSSNQFTFYVNAELGGNSTISSSNEYPVLLSTISSANAAIASLQSEENTMTAHMASTSNPHNVTKTQVGLGSVTNNAQVKKISSSTDNAIVRWDGVNGDIPQDSLVTIDDSGSVNIPSGQKYKINGTNLSYSDIGASASSHNHSASEITSGTIDIARLPSGALERLVPVADQTARYALTSTNVQNGDTVKQLDTGVLYLVVDDSKLSSADGYQIYTAGSATSVPWSGITDKPTTLEGYGITDAASSTHNHSGTYEPANANIQSHISSTSNPHSVTKSQVGLTNVTDNAQVKKISSATDNAIMRWDGTSGDTPQDSLVTVDDSGSINIPSGQKYKINGSALTYTDVNAASSDHNHDAQYLGVVSNTSLTAPTFISTTPTGTAPFSVTSTTKVANLNSDTLDGYEASQLQGFYTPIDQYYETNTKLIDICNNANYTAGAGTQSADGTNYKVQNLAGTGALKLLEPDNGASNLYTRHNISALDLTKFNDGSVSSTDDKIYFVFYVSDATKIDSTNGVLLNLANDTDWNNYYYFKILDATTGWNFYEIGKSTFTSVGSGNTWNSIVSIQLQWYSTINAQDAYITFNLIQMVRKDPLTTIANPFQRNINGTWTRDFAINSGDWYVGLENGDIVCKQLDKSTRGVTNSAALLGTKGYSDNFIITYTTKSVSNNSIYGLNWEIDDDTKICAVIESDVLYLQEIVQTGTINAYTATFAQSADDIIEFRLRKYGNQICLLVFKNNDYNNPVALSATITISGTGYVGIRTDSTQSSNIKSLSITTTEHAHHSSIAEIAKNVENKWKEWTPTLTWGTATPEGSVAQTARYTQIGNNVHFVFKYSATDGNGASSLAITLPVTPKNTGVLFIPSAIQLQNTTYTNPLPYIDTSVNTINFVGFATCTNAQAVAFYISGFYEV